MKLTKTVLLASLLLLRTVSADIGLSNARHLAMGGAVSGVAMGIDAVLTNPANLSIKTNTPLNISLLHLGAYADNNSFTKKLYDRYNGALLTEADKTTILKTIPAAGVRAFGRMETQPLAVGYGPFAFSILVHADANGWFDKQMFELLFNGNQLDRKYNFAPLRAGGAVLSSYILSYGFSIPLSAKNIQQMGVGINLKYLRGHYIADMQEINVQSLTVFTQTSATGSASFRAAQGGSGMAADLGYTVTFFRRWRASLVVENIGALIKWNKKPEMTQAQFTMTDKNIEQIIDQDLDVEEVIITNDTTHAVAGFATTIPLTFRVGLVRGFRGLYLAAMAEHSVKNSLWTSNKTILALGSEFLPNTWLRIRAGARWGGGQEPRFSAGFGLNIRTFVWDTALVGIGSALPSRMKGMGFAAGISYKY